MRKLFNIVAIGTIVHILINSLYYGIYVVLQENSILDLIFVISCLLVLVIVAMMQVILIKNVRIKKSRKEKVENICYTLEKVITFSSFVALVYLDIDVAKYTQENLLFLLIYIIIFHSIIILQIGLKFNKKVED